MIKRVRFVLFYVQFLVLARICLHLFRFYLNFKQIMWNLFPRYGGIGGGRVSEWGFAYGLWTFGQLPDDVDPDAGPLPPIDYTNIAKDSWRIRASLRASGVHEDQWDWYLDRKSGPFTFHMCDDIVYDTLLYRMCSS